MVLEKDHLNSIITLKPDFAFRDGITYKNPQKKEKYLKVSWQAAVSLSTVQEISIVNSGVYIR